MNSLPHFQIRCAGKGCQKKNDCKRYRSLETDQVNLPCAISMKGDDGICSDYFIEIQHEYPIREKGFKDEIN